MPLIDAHQHFWDPARGDYGWIPPGHTVLDRAYGPADLAPHLAEAGIEGTVLVQAAPTVAETDYLLSIAAEHPMVRGVVGWIDFENRADLRQLERLARNPLFKGVRPMIQDIPDPDWMLGKHLGWAFDAVTDLDLTFDALGLPQHIAPLRRLLSDRPRLRTVIDHCLKPRIRDDDPAHLKHWADGMAGLAGDTSAVLKLSALVTEDRPDWSVDRLRPYVEPVLAAFGANRVMWGSDWPVVHLRCGYADWVDAARSLTRHLSGAEQAQIFGKTATSFYRL